MACACASAIKAEMADWVALGGGNSGCCGNAAHTYGFHRPANEISSRDYSRRHDTGTPVDMNWACAGDFAHKNQPALRARHAQVLARLMRGELPMICEMITKPWPDKPVYYWARWNGVGVLQRYTGSGHDTWSHISWFRSKADQRAYLWTAVPAGVKVAKPAASTSFPKYPGRIMEFSKHPKVDPALLIWQRRMKQRGWNITPHGMFGPNTLLVVKEFQKEKRLGVDGVIGPKTWASAWTLPVT